MIFFISAGILCILFAYLSQYKGCEKLILLSLFIIFYIMAFQDSIAIDFASYKSGFVDILSGNTHGVLFRTDDNRGYSVEYGWYALNFLLGKVFKTFYAVTVVTMSFYCYTLYQFIRRIPKRWLWVAIAYFYFQPMLFFMSGLRQSVAICFYALILLCLYEKKYKQVIVLIPIGFLFHNSVIYGVFFIPFYYLFIGSFGKRNKVLLSIFFMAFFVVSLLFIDGIQSFLGSFFTTIVDDRFDAYNSYMEELGGANYSSLNIVSKVFILSLTLIAFNACDDKLCWIIGLSIVAQITSNLFGYNGNLLRIVYYISFFTIPAYAMIPYYLKTNVLKWLFALFVVFLALRTFINSLSNLQYIHYQNYHTIFNVF